MLCYDYAHMLVSWRRIFICALKFGHPCSEDDAKYTGVLAPFSGLADMLVRIIPGCKLLTVIGLRPPSSKPVDICKYPFSLDKSAPSSSINLLMKTIDVTSERYTPTYAKCSTSKSFLAKKTILLQNTFLQENNHCYTPNQNPRIRFEYKTRTSFSADEMRLK